MDGGVVKGVEVLRVGWECHFLCPFQDLKSIWGKELCMMQKNLSVKFRQGVSEDEDGIMLISTPACAVFCRQRRMILKQFIFIV